MSCTAGPSASYPAYVHAADGTDTACPKCGWRMPSGIAVTLDAELASDSVRNAHATYNCPHCDTVIEHALRVD